MTSLAIMQPYFYPYLGYFELFKKSDVFVIFDDVQFPRRGWVHRNQLCKQDGTLDWLTLPIKKCPRYTLIKDLEFSDDASSLWQKRIKRFPKLMTQLQADNELSSVINDFNKMVIDYLIDNLHFVCSRLYLPWNVIRSSTLNIPKELKNQDRILAIIKLLKADHYINLPGGKNLYDKDIFDRYHIRLEFLDTQYFKKESVLNLV